MSVEYLEIYFNKLTYNGTGGDGASSGFYELSLD